VFQPQRLSPYPSKDAYPVDLGFLAFSRFAAKALCRTYWILLDFLGFSRPNLDFSMGYKGFSAYDFSMAFEAPGGESKALACGGGRIVHEATLIQFLIFCKILPESLSSGRSPSAASIQKPLAVSSKKKTRQPPRQILNVALSSHDPDINPRSAGKSAR
jgi:hypothetical protein